MKFQSKDFNLMPCWILTWAFKGGVCIFAISNDPNSSKANNLSVKLSLFYPSFKTCFGCTKEPASSDDWS